MTAFDNLSDTARALLIAKLRWEIVSANCVNILDLAHKRNQPISELWHDICRKSKQVYCSMPHEVMETQYTKADPSIESAAAMSAQLAAAEPSANGRDATSSSSARGAGIVATTARIGVSRVKVIAINAPARPREKTVAAGRHNQHAHHGAVMLATAVGVLLVMGIGTYMMITPSGSGAGLARPTETIRRVDHATSDEQTRAQSKQADAVNVPPPKGTLRRMDAISKAFSSK